MNTRIVSLAFGIVFVTVGLLGFYPNPIVSKIGFFATNGLHNLVHILLGIGFIYGTLKSPGRESRVLKFFGFGGIAVTALGFLTEGDKLLGLIHVNQADHWLHLGLTLAVLAAGYGLRDPDAPSRKEKVIMVTTNQ